MSERHEKLAREVLGSAWGDECHVAPVAAAIEAAERRGAEAMQARAVAMCKLAADKIDRWEPDDADTALNDMGFSIGALDIEHVLVNPVDRCPFCQQTLPLDCRAGETPVCSPRCAKWVR